VEFYSIEIMSMSIDAVLHEHFSRYPAMQIQDVYKLLHQGVMGSEHAVSDMDGVRTWIERELVEMGSGPDDPPFDPISADGQIVRVHLHPFVQQGGNTDKLLDAFIHTASTFHGNTQALESCWQVAIDTEYFPRAAMDIFFQTMRAQNHPAVHHSLDYEGLYRPAYRVVLKELLT
jgi:hypothetical protein